MSQGSGFTWSWGRIHRADGTLHRWKPPETEEKCMFQQIFYGLGFSVSRGSRVHFSFWALGQESLGCTFGSGFEYSSPLLGRYLPALRLFDLVTLLSNTSHVIHTLLVSSQANSLKPDSPHWSLTSPEVGPSRSGDTGDVSGICEESVVAQCNLST